MSNVQTGGACIATPSLVKGAGGGATVLGSTFAGAITTDGPIQPLGEVTVVPPQPTLILIEG